MRNLTNSVAFYSKFAAVSGFHKNSRSFFENSFFFQGETTFLTLWEPLLIQLHPTTNFLSLAFYKKFYCFIEKPIYFSLKKQNLNVSRGPTFSIAFYRKFATFSDFLKKKQYFFQKTHHILPSKNLNLERFENFINWVAFYSISAKVTVSLKK